MKFTVHGETVQVATGGRALRADEPLVVLVHGAGMDRTVWAQQTRYVAFRGHRAVAVDLPGHGGSSGAALGSIADMADWLASVVDELGGPAHLVGHSMGSLVAVAAAARHSASVASVVLLGVADEMPVHPDLLAAAGIDDRLADELIMDWSLDPTHRLGANPNPGMWMLGDGISLLGVADDGVLAADLVACNEHHDAAAQLAGLDVPITIVSGALDRMTPARSAARLAAANPATIEVVIPATGHMLMSEQPEAVRVAIIDHLHRALRPAVSEGAGGGVAP